MRIGIDVSPLHRPHPAGIVRVTRALADTLERRARHEIVRLVPPPGISLLRWRQLHLPREVKKLELCGIHSCVSAFAWRGAGLRVQTIHELPWKHAVRENAGWRHKAWVAFGPLRAQRVVTATEFVARELRQRWSPGAKKIRVIPWAADAAFTSEPPADVIDEVVLGRYRLPQSALALCLGAVRPKKNLSAVLQGLAELRRRGGPWVQLVVSGGDTPQLRKDLGLASRLGLARFVSTLDHIAETDLPSLLRLASVVPLLSTSEGFGLSVLESMACATPVLVPARSAQAEVAGSAGIQVEAADPSSVADGFERALAERESSRAHLVQRASEFSWERSAAAIESLWEEIA